MNKILNTLSRYIENNNYLLFSIVYLVIGILIMIFNQWLFSSFISILLLMMLLTCLKDLIENIKKDKITRLTMLKSLVNTIVVFILLYFVDIPKTLFIMVLASYLVINGIIRLLSFILIKMDKSKGEIHELVEGLIYFNFGIVCFFSPKIHMDTMLYLVGAYFILLGVNYLFDFLEQKNIRIKHIRIPLPPFVDALIPFSVLQKLNHVSDLKLVELDLNKNNQEVDLEIFVHVSPNGSGKFGHVDLCFENQVISYGNYDKDSRKLREGLGSGVVFTTNKNEYIHFCIDFSEKTLFGFGIKLTKDQKEKVENELLRIKENLVKWEPIYVREKKKNKKINEEDYQDYASMLYKRTKAKFYKFKTGKLKTYFILGTNCGTLVDKILRSSGADVLKMNGIITPGTYYEFLEKEYMKKGSQVVTKRIYNKENMKDLKK